MNELEQATEELAALRTERAFLAENGKTARVAAVDDQIDTVQARVAVARQAAGLETTDATPPKRRGKPKGVGDTADGS